MGDLRVLRIPFSTNVERVALAAGHKGITIDWVDVDPDDRREVQALSGQDLVPVAVDPDDGSAVADSPRIVALIERRWPEPSLWPSDPGDAALADVFCHRFNEVWKGPPNRISDLLGPVGFDVARLSESERRAVDDDRHRMRTWLDRFEARLEDAAYLGGDRFGVCDVTAYPFLRYGIQPAQPRDADPFHRVLREQGAFDDASHPRLAAWTARVAEHPQA